MSDSWTGSSGRVGAVEYVLRDLVGAIEGGIVVVGERLPAETALAARYGVSRAVVREVLRVCEARGLTMTRNGRGTFVTSRRGAASLSFGDFSAAHMMEARPHIEIPGAGLAAIRRSDADIEELQSLLEEMRETGDAARWVELDIRLHIAIAEASGNPVFVEIITRVSDALVSQSSLLNRNPQRRPASDGEHRAIISAIARGSIAEAEDAMQYHLDQVKEALSLIEAP